MNLRAHATDRAATFVLHTLIFCIMFNLYMQNIGTPIYLNKFTLYFATF